MRIGIIGAGTIAGKVSHTLQQRWGDMLWAVAARDLSRAQEFAQRYGFERAYGSYEQLVSDPQVDIVYVATPHSHHYAHARLALEHGKAVICEKAFTANVAEAQALVKLARERNLLLMEAMWTRFMPITRRIGEVLRSGVIGRPRMLTASLSWSMTQIPRIRRADLCGGALLDLGIYCLTFADMFMGHDIECIKSNAVLGGEGVDWASNVAILYKNGSLASLQSSACCYDKRGVIACENGLIEVDAVNWPQHVVVRDSSWNIIEEFGVDPTQVSGYEYEFLAAREALQNGWIEHPLMTHDTTLRMMHIMDSLRHEWGVVYPKDNIEL